MSKAGFFSDESRKEIEELLAASKKNYDIDVLLTKTHECLAGRPELLMRDPVSLLELPGSYSWEKSEVFYATEKVIYTSLGEAMAGEIVHFES